jgi:transposase
MAKRLSWEVSVAFWDKVRALIPVLQKRRVGKEYKRNAGGGRKPMDTRKIFEGIVYVLRTGCQWKALPKERFGSASSIHAYFLPWLRDGFFLRLWRAGSAEYDELKGIACEWQSVDGAMAKAPLAREDVGPNPTDRGKNGSKRHLLADERGVPLSIVVTGANRHGVSQLETVLDAIVIARPQEAEQHLCADKGYHGNPAREAMETMNYAPHVRQRGEEAEAKRLLLDINRVAG